MLFSISFHLLSDSYWDDDSQNKRILNELLFFVPKDKALTSAIQLNFYLQLEGTTTMLVYGTTMVDFIRRKYFLKTDI